MKRVSLTNVLLAIIAFCLVFNLLVNGNLITKAQAQNQTATKRNEPQEVIIVGISRNVGQLPVSLGENQVNVNIQQIGGDAFHDADPIRVRETRY